MQNAYISDWKKDMAMSQHISDAFLCIASRIMSKLNDILMYLEHFTANYLGDKNIILCLKDCERISGKISNTSSYKLYLDINWLNLFTGSD